MDNIDNPSVNVDEVCGIRGDNVTDMEIEAASTPFEANDNSLVNNSEAVQKNGPDETVKAWWLDANPLAVAASYKASQAQFARLKDLSKDTIELDDSEDDELTQELESYRLSSISNSCKLRPGLTAQDEINVWAKILSVAPESMRRLSDPIISVASAPAHPPFKAKARNAVRPSARTLKSSPVRRTSYSPMRGEAAISREASPIAPSDSIKYPRLSRPIVLSDEQVRSMLRRIENAPRPSNADYSLSQKFQKIIRYGKFFESEALNDALGIYLSSCASLPEAFKLSMTIFWDAHTLETHTIPSKIDSLDLRPDQILPIIPLQHEFWTYWNAITDEKNMQSKQRHSLMTIVGLVNSKHNKASSLSSSSHRRVRAAISDESYYDYDCHDDSQSQAGLNRVNSSILRSPRLPMSEATTSTRQSYIENMSSRGKIISQRPSPHRSLSSSSSNRSSSAMPDRRAPYSNSSPQQPSSSSNNHKYPSYPSINGSSPNTSSDMLNHPNNNSGASKASRSVSSSKAVGREAGRAFDSLFADRIEEMLATCSTLFKPMSAQPKAESWLTPDAIERLNNLQFFSDMGLNISVGVIILSQGTIGAAVRAIAIVFWGQNSLYSQKVMKPASKFNMTPVNPSGLPGETAFHSLWNCILQFERDDTIYERYLRAVNYIAESMRKEQQLSVRTYSPGDY